MSAGMAEVIAAHGLWDTRYVGTPWLRASESAKCSCGHEHGHWIDTPDGPGCPDWDDIHHAHVAEELTKAGYGNVQAKGYLIVDKVTGALDWDGELHPTVEAALSSLCGPHQSFCRDPEDFTGDDTTYWADVYAIHPVSAPLDPNVAAALADPEGHALVKAIHDRKAEANGN